MAKLKVIYLGFFSATDEYFFLCQNFDWYTLYLFLHILIENLSRVSRLFFCYEIFLRLDFYLKKNCKQVNLNQNWWNSSWNFDENCIVYPGLIAIFILPNWIERYTISSKFFKQIASNPKIFPNNNLKKKQLYAETINLEQIKKDNRKTNLP